MSSDLTLFNIEDDLQALVNSEDLVGPDQQNEYRLQLSEQLKTAVDKRQRMGEFIRYCELMQENCNLEINRVEKLKKSFAAAEKRAREYVIFTIKSIGSDAKGKYPKLNGRTITLSVQPNPDSVEIQDADLIANKYRRVTVKIPADTWSTVLATFESGDPAANEVYKILKAADDACSVDFDKTAIKEDIKAGQTVTGADLIIDRLRCKVG